MPKAEGRWQEGLAKPPKAISKPPQSHILGIDSGVQRHPKASLKPHQGHTKATSRLHQGYTKATPRPHQSHTHATLKPPTSVVCQRSFRGASWNYRHPERGNTKSETRSPNQN